MDRFEGRVWVFGDNVDTDQIIPAERLVAASTPTRSYRPRGWWPRTSTT